MVQDEIDPVDINDPSDNEDTENMVEKPEAAKSQLLFLIIFFQNDIKYRKQKVSTCLQGWSRKIPRLR